MKISLEEWKKRSENGEVCGILGCQEKTEILCPHCGNWYCEGHKFVLNLPGHSITKIELNKVG